MNWNHIKQDLSASIVVFLVAIPLCLGIALASGAPLYSGIIAGIIGGILVGTLSQSRVSVSGPAAGMIAVVIAATATIGSFHGFLLALMLAGILQIAIGALRAGFLADYVPSNVIQGLLAAIGILIIIKQLPLAFGVTSDTSVVLHSIKSAQQDFSFAPLLHLIHHISLAASIISILSLAVLIFWEKINLSLCKKIPAAVVVVVGAVALNHLFASSAPSFALTDSHLVNIPVNKNIFEVFAQLPHPKFSDYLNPNIYLYAGIIAIVASLETLLNLEAAEKLDPHHRFCSRNNELVAQGIGNTISGLLGGLPITSVIVRTSVNIQTQNHSKASTIIHGGLLLIALLLIPSWLNQIPLAALASILIATGYKLTRLSLFKKMYKEGRAYFTAFIVTVTAIVFTNLLVGVLIGLAVGLFFILRMNSQNSFLHIKEKHTSGEVLRIKLPQHVTFLNKAAMVNALESIPKHSRVIIDVNNTDFIDKDILEVMKEFSTYQAGEKNISLNFVGLQSGYRIKHTSDFIVATTFDVQEKLTPKEVVAFLKEGNQRFVNNTPIHKDFKRQISITSEAQHPIAVVLSCMDSRVPVENIFDLNLGDVFVIRIAGNIINSDILASIEFGCKIAGAKLIMVLGHKRCGAVTAACDEVKLEHLTQLLEKIRPAISRADIELKNERITTRNKIDHVACVNVQLVQQQLYAQSKTLREQLSSSKIGLVGGMYDVATGEVTFEEVNHTIEEEILDSSLGFTS